MSGEDKLHLVEDATFQFGPMFARKVRRGDLAGAMAIVSAITVGSASLWQSREVEGIPALQDMMHTLDSKIVAVQTALTDGMRDAAINAYADIVMFFADKHAEARLVVGKCDPGFRGGETERTCETANRVLSAMGLG